MALTHKYTLVCDEVRQENNGKFIILGLYTPSMSIPQIPFTIPSLTFFMCFESDRPDQLQFTVRLTDLTNGQQVAQAMGVMTINKPGMGISLIRFPNITFQNAGAYTFELRVGNDPAPLVLHQFDVLLMPPQQGATFPQMRQ